MNSIWSQIKQALFVVHFTNVEDVKSFRDAIKEAGLNINDCEIIAVVATKKEKDLLPVISSVTFVNTKEFGLLGKIKNENFKKVIPRAFDALFYVGDFSKSLSKHISRINKKIAIGINSQMNDCSVYINTNSGGNTHLVNFAKQTLEKTI